MIPLPTTSFLREARRNRLLHRRWWLGHVVPASTRRPGYHFTGALWRCVHAGSKVAGLLPAHRWFRHRRRQGHRPTPRTRHIWHGHDAHGAQFRLAARNVRVASVAGQPHEGGGAGWMVHARYLHFRRSLLVSKRLSSSVMTFRARLLIRAASALRLSRVPLWFIKWSSFDTILATSSGGPWARV